MSDASVQFEQGVFSFTITGSQQQLDGFSQILMQLPGVLPARSGYRMITEGTLWCNVHLKMGTNPSDVVNAIHESIKELVSA